MRIGSLTIDSIIDGETSRTLPYLYASAPPAELEAGEAFTDHTGNLVMSIGSYLIRGAGRTVLVDAGVGPKPTPPFTGGALLTGLQALGVDPDDITDVVFTHLHSDHIGWSTQEGEVVFRNAAYRCDRRDWDHFVSASYDMPAWEKAQTNPEVDAALVRLAPLADRMEFWEGEAEILPGLHTLDAAGHTPGTDAFIISSDGERGVLLGDIVHCQPELLYGWKFPVHTEAVSALESVERMRDYLVEQQLPCSASHFTGMSWGRVVKDGNGYAWVPQT